jgi:ELWxxDGT repeat protein
VLGSKAVFRAHNLAFEAGLWVTDGTPGGTKELNHIDGTYRFGLSPAHFAVFGANALFEGNAAVGESSADARDGLWITDETDPGTTEIKPSHANSGGIFAGDFDPGFALLGGKMLFEGKDDKNHAGLWVTDGTSKGTSVLKVAKADSEGLFSTIDARFTVLGKKALFARTDSHGVVNLWVTDGTPGGTVELAPKGASPSGLYPADITVFGTTALFQGVDESGTAGLWVTDGTSGGTIELKVAHASAAFGLSPQHITLIPPPPPPPAPTGLALASASDSGVKGDLVTRVTRPVITGKGEAADKLTLLDGAKAIGTGTVGAKGTWSVTPAKALSAGVHTLTATESGKTGVSAKSAALKLTIKVSAPVPSGLWLLRWWRTRARRATRSGSPARARPATR